jgi:hypothetical protein
MRKAQSGNSGPRRESPQRVVSSLSSSTCASTLRGYFYVFNASRVLFWN